MENEVYVEQHVPSGVLKSIRFKVLSEEDAEKASVKEVTVANEVTDPAFGFPNPASQCHTCGAKDYRTCEGHIGLIKFPFTILHPYYLPEVAQILNKICPGCKNLRKDKAKNNATGSPVQIHKVCKYCDKNYRDIYPPMKFKVSTKDVFGKTAIIVEVKGSKKLVSELPRDFWDFVINDPQQEESFSAFNRKVLTHVQVYQILKDVDPIFLNGSLGKKNKIFLQSFPLTPNCHRVAEFGQNLTFDERTRAYRKMVGFRGTASELGACVLECIKLSKIRAEKPTLRDPDADDNPSKMHGLKYMKEVSLGKRTDFCFRMVCVGDPYIKLDEIGVPHEIAETMLVSEQLNSFNWEKINASCGLRILQRGEIFIRRRGGLVPVRYGDQLRIGDTVYRPLTDGDVVLINRPPSIHSHSLIALRVKVLPVKCVLSVNPLICSPLRGDFDGDSLHGYIPQSLECRVELRELVTLENQLVDKQSGKSLLSLSHDSLTAAHLMLDDGVFLNRSQFQQLQMFCPRQQLELPVIMKKFQNLSSSSSCLWTGRQLFSLVLDNEFDLDVGGTQIKKGEFVSLLNPSSCLQDGDENIYGYLIKNFRGDKVLEFLHSAQELLIEWLSIRGFSVSLLDLYLCSDSKNNLNDEVVYGLHEAERQAHGQLLMVDGHQDFLTGNLTENEGYSELESDKMCHDQQTSAALSRASAAAFKEVFRDLQSLIYNYVSKENSFVSMLKAGSKGNMLKFVQHSMCVGYQHSLVPLSFHFPREFSCVSWNNHKRADLSFPSGVDRYVPYGVIKSSFLLGLNPFELLVHSVTNRDASFGGHADISGTLFRKLMFFMRDLYIGYDGTVRNCYGNQLVQFSYYSRNAPGESKSLLAKEEYGAAVGSLAACAISEAAYGALDQPISALENSPLLNLKKVLECGVKKLSGNKTASLFLSQKLKRWNNGFEYGAIDVKNHLEKLLFQDVVSLVTIFYSKQTGKRSSPWICYFCISKEFAHKKQVKVQAVINALRLKCADSSNYKKLKLSLPKLHISSKEYPGADAMTENSENIFITAQIMDVSNNTLNILQDVVVPFLLETVIKGSPNVKKVEIMWQDYPKTKKSFKDSPGELYLRVFMSESCDRRNFWRAIMGDCVQIMDIIDWERSHPDDIQDVILAQGIDAARNHFLRTLKSAIEDTGKSILPQHLALAADCLSVAGEFAPLNAKGFSLQRKQASVSAPFTQACFANPSDCFVKAAKSEASDKLEGTIDALSWGKVPALGTGGRFDILFSGKEHQIEKPVDVYSLLSKTIDFHEEKSEVLDECHNSKLMSNKSPAMLFPYPDFDINASTDAMKTVLKRNISAEDIKRLSKDLKHILYKYDVNHKLSQDDRLVAWKALFFHPRRQEKIGIGLYEIKVGHHLDHGNTRCFVVERIDGTTEDFSYHKCIHHALKLIAPFEAKVYESRWLNGKE